MMSNKKRTYKLSRAGKLVSVVVLIVIVFTFQLYINSKVSAIQAETQVIKLDIETMKREILTLYAYDGVLIDKINNLELNKEGAARKQALEDYYAPKEYEKFLACDSTSTFKSWMDYETITDSTSKQYELAQKSKANAEGHMELNDRILLAIANFDVGDELNISLSSGTIINAIVGDVKATDCSHPDGSVIEFVVDSNIMSQQIKRSGDYNGVYEGTITLIERVGNYYE